MPASTTNPEPVELDDQPMSDAPDAELSESLAPLTAEQLRLRVLPGSSDTAASFEFLNEDHTLGNALRWVIMKNPDVEFCGYSIPHPSEAKMNVRIQTYDGVSVYEILEKGLKDLEDLCNVVTEKFETARDEFGKQATRE